MYVKSKRESYLKVLTPLKKIKSYLKGFIIFFKYIKFKTAYSPQRKSSHYIGFNIDFFVSWTKTMPNDYLSYIN
jgi:hypothetical protein